MVIVVLDETGVPVRQTDDWDGSLAYGEDENDFEITRIAGDPLRRGMRWQVDGTPYAGIVDTVCPSVDDDGATSVSYKGRTVQGVLAAKVVEPPAGSAHRTATGDLNECIAELVELCGLSGYLSVPSAPCGIEVSGYQYRRYINAWDGLRMLCQSAGARPRVACSDGGVSLGAVAADTYGDMPSELVSFSAERTYRPTNHMVGLGEGEGTARLVSHWYADESGNLSQTQTLFGLDEVAETTNLSSESDELSAKTRDALSERQGQGTFEADVPEEASLDVGDVVAASDSVTGLSLAAEVTKVTVEVSMGVATVSYETGTPQWPDEED